MSDLLRDGLKALIPMIRVTTEDPVSVEQVLQSIAQTKHVQHIDSLSVAALYKVDTLLWTDKPALCTTDTYETLDKKERTIVFVNCPANTLYFDAGELLPTKALIQSRVQQYTQTDLTPMLTGLSLKGVEELLRLTSVKFGNLLPTSLKSMRAILGVPIQGLYPVDTHLDFYHPYKPLQEWLGTNHWYFMAEGINPVLRPRGLLLDGLPGCLSGTTSLLYRRGKRSGSRPITLETLYKKFNNLPGVKDPVRDKTADTFLHSMREDGTLFYNKVMAIVVSGVKPCFRLTTKGGNSITLTADHPVCNADGVFVEAQSLKVGDVLRMKGTMLPTGTDGKKKRVVHRREVRVKHHPVAGTKVVNGCTYKRLHFARAVVEANLNGLDTDTYLARLNNGILEGLVFLTSDQEVHHRDENVRNDAIGNLAVLTKKEHATYHALTHNFKTEYAVLDEVLGFSEVGQMLTFDIQMEAPAHNFVADGFIVHNTGKTSAAKYIAGSMGIPLYRLDVATSLNKYIGESEIRMMKILRQLEEYAPCVVLLDEVEKVFVSDSDSGVVQRMMSQLLWWLSEHRSQVLTIMTTNNRKAIPPELFREGRINDVMEIPPMNSSQALELGQEYLKMLIGPKIGLKHTVALKFPKNEVFTAVQVINTVIATVKLHQWGLPTKTLDKLN